jgi:dolichol-phosphate mannosyltransferase
MSTLSEPKASHTLSVVIPCFNEEKTLARCVERVRQIADESLHLEILIVDDCSKDRSLEIARRLAATYPDVKVLEHRRNQGKGAALRTGFAAGDGDFFAVQDADLEYDPNELKKLLEPLISNQADVVIGSRFLAAGAHRVLYFWHSLGNRFLTFVSNMFSDLNLTDMESCYKVFRKEIIKSITLEENRFGFEPEIVAKVAEMRVRVFEAGISYYGRTYEEGKKIGVKDGFRALYCILHYNLHRAPLPIQFLFYLLIGAAAALVNLVIFVGMMYEGADVTLAAPVAFVIAAGVNYLLSILLLFRHKARWNSALEIVMYIVVVAVVGYVDLWTTSLFLSLGRTPAVAKLGATAVGLVLNFLGRRFWVFPERSRGPWNPQSPTVA